MKIGTFIIVNRIIPLICIIIFVLVVAGSFKWVLQNTEMPTTHIHCGGETVKNKY